MKKSELRSGLALILAGLCCLAAGLFPLWETDLGNFLCGFAFALAVPGTAQVLKYRKWSRPENAAAYREKQEREGIDLRDELKEMLRDKSGRYAYVVGVMLCAASILVFCVLGKLGLVTEHRLIVLFLGGFLLVQLAAGFLFYRLLDKKY